MGAPPPHPDSPRHAPCGALDRRTDPTNPYALPRREENVADDQAVRSGRHAAPCGSRSAAPAARDAGVPSSPPRPPRQFSRDAPTRTRPRPGCLRDDRIPHPAPVAGLDGFPARTGRYECKGGHRAASRSPTRSGRWKVVMPLAPLPGHRERDVGVDPVGRSAGRTANRTPGASLATAVLARSATTARSRRTSCYSVTASRKRAAAGTIRTCSISTGRIPPLGTAVSPPNSRGQGRGGLSARPRPSDTA